MSETKNDPMNPVNRLAIFEESISSLKDLLEIQSMNGNWNYDPYMHGMANGMILALSLFQEGIPDYLEAPDVWLVDIPNDAKPTTCDEDKT